MAFEAVISPAVSALCAGCICCAMTAERLRGNRFLMIVLPIIAAAAGIWYSPLSYAAAAVVLAAILCVSGARLSEAVTAAFSAAASSFLILLFVNAMVAQRYLVNRILQCNGCTYIGSIFVYA